VQQLPMQPGCPISLEKIGWAPPDFDPASFNFFSQGLTRNYNFFYH